MPFNMTGWAHDVALSQPAFANVNAAEVEPKCLKLTTFNSSLLQTLRSTVSVQGSACASTVCTSSAFSLG